MFKDYLHLGSSLRVIFVVLFCFLFGRWLVFLLVTCLKQGSQLHFDVQYRLEWFLPLELFPGVHLRVFLGFSH